LNPEEIALDTEEEYTDEGEEESNPPKSLLNQFNQVSGELQFA